LGRVWVGFGLGWVGLGLGVGLGVGFGVGLGLVPNSEKNLVMVLLWFLRLSFRLVLLCFDRTRKPFFKNFATFLKLFFSIFLKNMKIQYKNTFNQTKIRISQNLMFKNDNNIIFRQFENILYFEIFKCLVLGLGCVEKSQFDLVWV
jgi:hypothetical protein